MKNKDETFELVFQENWIKKGSILKTGINGNFSVEVIEDPTIKYKKWYWRVLNFLTLKYYFNVRYTYICKIKN